MALEAEGEINDMKKFILEACVDSVASALAAERGGADRIELCANLVIGGTTPDINLFREIRKHSQIPARVLLRPRFGDFCFDDYEYEILLEDVRMFREAGADGIVVGSLNPDGTLNERQMEGFVKAAGDLGVTLHRAFDMCVDPYDTFCKAKSMGIDTILTSGQAPNCLEGQALIADLVQVAGDDMTILVGAGVNASVIEKMYGLTKATAYHMSGKVTKDSAMTFRRETVNMGLPGLSEYDIWQTDEEYIRKARKILNGIMSSNRV